VSANLEVNGRDSLSIFVDNQSQNSAFPRELSVGYTDLDFPTICGRLFAIEGGYVWGLKGISYPLSGKLFDNIHDHYDRHHLIIIISWRSLTRLRRRWCDLIIIISSRSLTLLHRRWCSTLDDVPHSSLFVDVDDGRKAK